MAKPKPRTTTPARIVADTPMTRTERTLSRAEVWHAQQIHGCLFGLAIGDALGAPVEFLSRDAIRARYGKRGIQDFQPWGGFPAGTWTDDTQMAMATMAGIIDMLHGILEPPAPRAAMAASPRNARGKLSPSFVRKGVTWS